MKKITAALCAMLFMCQPLLAQQPANNGKKNRKQNKAVSERRYIEFDYLADSSHTYTRVVKEGTDLGIRIKNVNKRLVTITSQFAEKSFHADEPALFEMFSKAKLPEVKDPGNGFTRMPAEEKSTIRTKEPGLADRIDAVEKDIDALSTSITEAIEHLKSFITNYNRIKYLLSYHKAVIGLQQSCTDSLPVILANLAELSDKMLRVSSTLDVDNADKAILVSKNYSLVRGVIDRVSTNSISATQKDYDAIAADFLPSKVATLRKKAEDITKALDELLAAAKAKRPVNNALVANIQQMKSTFTGVNDIADLEYMHTRVNPDKLIADVQAFESKGKDELLVAYDGFTPNMWTYEVSPEEIKLDESEFKVTVAPKENVTCMPGRQYRVKVRPRSGLKIDFSSGLFANFGDHTFKDQELHYDSVPGNPDQQKIVRSKNHNVVFPSVGALMHIYGRTGRNFNLAGTLGVSIKDLDKVNFHAGGSAIFGYSQRFILSAGVTLTKANLLSSKYENGQVIEKAGAPDPIPTTAYHRIGFFVAFTYNLTAKVGS